MRCRLSAALMFAVLGVLAAGCGKKDDAAAAGGGMGLPTGSGSEGGGLMPGMSNMLQAMRDKSAESVEKSLTELRTQLDAAKKQGGDLAGDAKAAFDKAAKDAEAGFSTVRTKLEALKKAGDAQVNDAIAAATTALSDLGAAVAAAQLRAQK